MNLSDEVDLEDYVSRPHKISAVDAVEIGKELARKHFIHHVFRENDFEDGSQNLYRFLEHDPAIPKYHNFRGSNNDGEPKSAASVVQWMTKITVAILEAYPSDDRRRDDYARRGQRGVHRRRVDYARCGQRGVHRRRVDYARVAANKEFRRYANLARDLQRVDVFAVLACERLPFFQNLHNAMAIHLCSVLLLVVRGLRRMPRSLRTKTT